MRYVEYVRIQSAVNFQEVGQNNGRNFAIHSGKYGNLIFSSVGKTAH
jgi:hypothetical protein